MVTFTTLVLILASSMALAGTTKGFTCKHNVLGKTISSTAATLNEARSAATHKCFDMNMDKLDSRGQAYDDVQIKAIMDSCVNICG